MIEAPLNALMGAIIPVLKGDEALSLLVGQRVYDRVPPSAMRPYVSLGAAWEAQDDADGIDALDIGFRIDVWSETIGFPEARRIAHRVRTLLHNFEIDMNEGALAMLEHRRSDTVRAPDGLTSQIAIEFTAVIET